MTLTHTPLITRDGGRQVDTRAMPRPHYTLPAFAAVPAADRYSRIWFSRLALLWFVASAAAGFALAYLGRP